MVKIIMGLKGSGKTKQLIDLVTKAVEMENGDVVCIEKGPKLTFDIPHKARLIYASQSDIEGYEFFRGFLSGLHAGNYDITHVFIDSLYKIVGDDTSANVDTFLEWLDRFSEKSNVKFTLTISADTALASEVIKRFL